MIEERILSAVERIDGAMTRIEAAAKRPPPPPAPDPSTLAELRAAAELRQHHDAMRGRIEAAIAELDTLIRNG